jgi:hypothetical protein
MIRLELPELHKKCKEYNGPKKMVVSQKPRSLVTDIQIIQSSPGPKETLIPEAGPNQPLLAL